MNRVTSRLAAYHGTRQVEAVVNAEAAAGAVDKAVGAVWRRLLAAMAQNGAAPLSGAPFAGLATGFFHAAHAGLGDAFRRLAMWGHRSAANNVTRSLPLEWLASLAVEKVRTGRVRLQEDEPEPRAPGAGDAGDARNVAGLLRLVLNGKLDFTDALGRLREPTTSPMSSTDAREFFQRLLFPPPDAQQINTLLTRLHIGGQTWEQQLRRAAHRFSPAAIASTVSYGYAAGKTQQQIARELLPVVDGLRASARRIARTYGLAVAHETNQQVSHQLGDLRVGDQVHATLDENTRPEHRHRNGTIYYFRPEPGQKPYGECPQPPREADGTLAWNCRCYLTPVLKAPANFNVNDVRWRPFTTAKDLVPDPAVYSTWFARADERRQRLAVGTARYNAALDALGGPNVITGRLPDGRQVDFTRELNTPREVLLYVDPQALQPFASPADEIGGRREGFREFLLKGVPIRASRVVLGKDGSPDFVNGRHRFAELAAQGIDRIAVSVPRRQAAAFKKKYGAVNAETGERRRPNYEHFVDPDTGGLLSVQHLRSEPPENRAERMAKVRREIAVRAGALRQVQTFGFVPG